MEILGGKEKIGRRGEMEKKVEKVDSCFNNIFE